MIHETDYNSKVSGHISLGHPVTPQNFKFWNVTKNLLDFKKLFLNRL
jgi:hypothetical protein